MPICLAIGRCTLCAAAIFAGFFAPCAQGGPAPLTLEQALERAIAENPALRGSEYLLQASRARESSAAQSPPFAVAAEFEDFAGNGSLTGVDALQTTLRLSGVLELGSRREARMSLAASETDAAAIEQRAQRLDVLAEVAARFTEVAAWQEELQVTEEAARLAAETVERVRERIRIGAAPDYELWRAEIEIARAGIARRQVEQKLSTARHRLAASWGAMEPGFERVSADLFSLPGTKNLEQLTSELDGTPAVQRMLSRERLAAAQLRLAESSASPELSWSGGLRQYQAQDETALVASVSIPFGSRRRAQPAIREAEALRAKTALDTESERIAAFSTLHALYQALLTARVEVEGLRSEVQPKAESVLRSTDQAFRQGRVSFLELAIAQQQLLDVRSGSVDAAARYHGLLIEIERLTGTAMIEVDAMSGESP